MGNERESMGVKTRLEYLEIFCSRIKLYNQNFQSKINLINLMKIIDKTNHKTCNEAVYVKNMDGAHEYPNVNLVRLERWF